jgi:hypothetical protein
MTVAEHFHGLDAKGRRDYLANLDIKVEKGITEGGVTEYHGIPLKSEGGKPGIRLVIDGIDYGVLPYPPATPEST